MNDLNNINDLTQVDLESIALLIDVSRAYNTALNNRPKTQGHPSNASDFRWPAVAADTANTLDIAYPLNNCRQNAFLEALERSIAARTNKWSSSLELR